MRAGQPARSSCLPGTLVPPRGRSAGGDGRVVLGEQRDEFALEVRDVVDNTAPCERPVAEGRLVDPARARVQRSSLIPGEPVAGWPAWMIPAEIATEPPWQMIPIGLPASWIARTSFVTAS